jgi:hypothetical protein
MHINHRDYWHLTTSRPHYSTVNRLQHNFCSQVPVNLGSMQLCASKVREMFVGSGCQHPCTYVSSSSSTCDVKQTMPGVVRLQVPVYKVWCCTYFWVHSHWCMCSTARCCHTLPGVGLQGGAWTQVCRCQSNHCLEGWHSGSLTGQRHCCRWRGVDPCTLQQQDQEQEQEQW